jgi:hypothetical protein
MYNVLKKHKFIYFSPIIFFLGACSSVYDNSSNFVNLNDQVSMLEKSPSRSNDYLFSQNSKYRVCSAPPPDAGFSQSEGGNFNFTLINLGSGPEAGSQDASSGDREMAGRTPAVILARELLYRTCELSVNYSLNKEEAQSLFQKTLSVINENWSKEASKTTVSIGDKTNFSEIVNKGINASISSSLTTPDSSTLSPAGPGGSVNDQSAPQPAAASPDSDQ